MYVSMWHACSVCRLNVPENTPIQSITCTHVNPHYNEGTNGLQKRFAATKKRGTGFNMENYWHKYLNGEQWFAVSTETLCSI